MKRKILFLTNIHNGDPKEDRFLEKELTPYFDLIVSHPLECDRYLSSIEGIIIRNIWPTYEYSEKWEQLVKKIKNLRIKTYNPLTGKGDNRGKDYLIELYKEGFPVIPSINKVEDINRLPESEFYYIKPKDSCDGFGDEKLTKSELMKKKLKDYIIQPYEEFSSEPSFFFIDNKFLYAITMPNRLTDRKIEKYEPTQKDLVFAKKFVEWESLPYGIQRVDAVRTKKGELLLTEDEDIAEYLYLLDMPSASIKMIVENIINSMKKVFV
jgi:hypothetical protein